jgi:tripartite-type tricarboxylate transporter receptor subunit TctC
VNALMQEAMRDPAIVQRLTSQVLEPVTESIEESRRFIAAEIVRATELLRSVNYQPE